MALPSLLGLDHATVKAFYRISGEAGRGYVRSALIAPGIRKSDLEKLAERNKDDVRELIAKRDAMIDAAIDFLEEVLNLDDD